jgi:hypothetical protein
MIQKGKKQTAGMDSHIQGGNLESLISEILKFRERRVLPRICFGALLKR